MRRVLVVLAVAVAVLVAGSGIAWAAFTAHRSTPQQLQAVDSFEPPSAGVLRAGSKSNDGGASTSQIQLGLRVSNVGDAEVDLADVTVRYWFTADGAPSLTTACYYATFGCDKLGLSMVKLDHAYDGSDHYLQVGFTSGKLAVGAVATLDQLAIRDQTGNVFHQDDDFSFVNRADFADNDRVTVYLRGELVWGEEPARLPDVESVEVQYANGDPDPKNEAIKPFLMAVNTGTVDIALPDLTLRYWFTRDTESEQLIGFCDYAVVSCDKVRLTFVPITPRPGADTYLEVGFRSGQLDVENSTGSMQLRAHRSDYGPFDETDDHSWASNTMFQQTVTVTAYLRGKLVWGTEP